MKHEKTIDELCNEKFKELTFNDAGKLTAIKGYNKAKDFKKKKDIDYGNCY